MNLKKYLAQDLDTFINLSEFADEIDIDSVKVAAVVSQWTGESQTEYTIKKQINPKMHMAALTGNFLTIYCKTVDLPRKVQSNDRLWYNGRKYKVETAQDMAGISRLNCTADTMQMPRSKLAGLFE